MYSCVTPVPNISPPSATTSAVSSDATRRTRTPPVFKWLLNERAALAGDAQRIETEVQRLEAELQRIQRELPAVREKLAALDATMDALDARVAPNAGGVVKAQGRHGRRGSLKAFILELLQASGSAGLNTMDLTLRTAAAFGVDLPTREHYSRYRSSIIFPVLRRGRDAGILEELQTSRNGPKPQVWRWRGPNATPSLAELQGLRELANKGG